MEVSVSDGLEIPADSDLKTSDKITSSSSKSTESETNKKDTHAIARERFLRFLLSAENKECEFRLYENTVLNGVYQGCDVGFSKIAVRDLKTPIAVYDSACLRTNDVLKMKFDASSW